MEGACGGRGGLYLEVSSESCARDDGDRGNHESALMGSLAPSRRCSISRWRGFTLGSRFPWAV